jgi:ketosteroid isomerase-like protein
MEGVRKKGAVYRNRYIFVFRVRNGRIVEMEEHLDTLFLHRIHLTEAEA